MKIGILIAMLVVPLGMVLAQPRKASKFIDPDDAYKNNCLRCHASVQAYSPKKTETIVMHMRVRANLTDQESRAIVEYLQDNAASARKGKQVKK